MHTGSGHIFSEILLHLNWHCKYDRPMITPEIEPALMQFLQEYCRKVKGVHYIDSGNTQDHVHLLFQLEPLALIEEFIGKIKGASSHEMNKQFGPGKLRWQRGYGIVSYSKKYSEALIKYVKNQKAHHLNGTTNPTLEEHGVDDPVGDPEGDG
ncbi:MAG: IS200/IS605 family transposase [Candidatus Sumerlaeota bacterium]|nr:IS200/IS605 family transposase [Candidatus Sumerlaeota bacterium]